MRQQQTFRIAHEQQLSSRQAIHRARGGGSPLEPFSAADIVKEEIRVNPLLAQRDMSVVDMKLEKNAELARILDDGPQLQEDAPGLYSLVLVAR